MARLTLRPLSLLLAGAALQLACAASPPPAEEPVVPTFKTHDYTVTWVAEVGPIGWPEPADCRRAEEVVAQNADCVGALCRYAADVLGDYLATCGEELAEGPKGEQETLLASLRERAAEMPDRCGRPPIEWLERGCGQEGACEEEARAWATRCGEKIQSPIVISLLESRIERSLRKEPRRVTLDLRSCEDLREPLLQAAECENQFRCEESLPAASSYAALCGSGVGSVMSIADGLKVRHVFETARKEIPELTVDVSVSSWKDVEGYVLLPEKRGLLLDVCGVALDTNESAASARAECEQGRATLMMLRQHGEAVHLETITVPFLGDPLMHQSASWLSTPGVAEAVEAALLERFESAVAALASSPAATWSAAASAFEAQLDEISWELLPAAKRAAVWQRHDDALRGLFTQIGRAKAQAITRQVDRQAALHFVRRAQVLLFSDIDEKGEIVIGSGGRLLGLHLAGSAPKAFSAYQGQLRWLQHSLSQQQVDESALSASQKRYSGARRACAEASDAVIAARQAFRVCALNGEECSTEQGAEFAKTFLDLLKGWQESSAAAAFTGATLGEDEAALCAPFGQLASSSASSR